MFEQFSTGKILQKKNSVIFKSIPEGFEQKKYFKILNHSRKKINIYRNFLKLNLVQKQSYL